ALTVLSTQDPVAEVADRGATEAEPRRAVAHGLGLHDEADSGVIVVARVEPRPELPRRGGGARREGGHGSITRWAMAPSRRANRKWRSTCPPGKFPSRWWVTS